MLTYLYHLFPNVMIATFPERIIVVVVEPLAVESDEVRHLHLTDRRSTRPMADGARAGGDLSNAGGDEDRGRRSGIQRGLASGANEFFEFGLFEGAIGALPSLARRAIETAARRRGPMSVRFESEGPVARIVIDRPEVANAIDRPTAERARGAFRRFDADDALAVAVLDRARTASSAPAPT